MQASASSLMQILLLSLLKKAHSDAANFNPINGYLCINGNFIETVWGDSRFTACAAFCMAKPNCQAFTTADGPCQLFVFDKCSKYVRDCNCTRRGQVFVKQQPGLQPGALCPSGYGDDLCGVKFKFRNMSGTWQQQQAFCQSESGSMVIMSDAIDATEMSQWSALVTKYSSELYVSAFQTPGSAEPAGGWFWADCGIPMIMNGTFWDLSEPNNAGTSENAGVLNLSQRKVFDILDTAQFKGLCECLSPFD